MNEKDLPSHLGGYQSVSNCLISEGDIWVRDGKPNCYVDAEWFGLSVPEPYQGFSVYRKLAVLRQGGERYN